MIKKIDDFKIASDTKMAEFAASFDKKLDDFKKESDIKVTELASSTQVISDMYDEQKNLNDNLLYRIEELEQHEEILRAKYMESEARVDALEQYGRRNCLLLHGANETENENTDQIIIDTANTTLGLNLRIEDISRSHRIGKPKTAGKPRPIIARFVRYRERSAVFANKKKLKGTGKMITESLTRTRFGQLQRAITRYGNTNVWTMDGNIFVKHNNQKKLYNPNQEFSDS